MSYISREAAIEIVINYEFENCPDYMRDFATKLKSAVCSDIRTDLQALPAADVVEVVRCKNCRFWYTDHEMRCCTCHTGLVHSDDNGYCYHGVRRKDDE